MRSTCAERTRRSPTIATSSRRNALASDSDVDTSRRYHDSRPHRQAAPMSNVFPPPPRLLLGPGPSTVPPRVLAALAQPLVGHLDPAFIALMEETKRLLRGVFQTENPLT